MRTETLESISYRYLAYDMMADNFQSVVHKPWKVRLLTRNAQTAGASFERLPHPESAQCVPRALSLCVFWGAQLALVPEHIL